MGRCHTWRYAIHGDMPYMGRYAILGEICHTWGDARHGDMQTWRCQTWGYARHGDARHGDMPDMEMPDMQRCQTWRDARHGEIPGMGRFQTWRYSRHGDMPDMEICQTWRDARHGDMPDMEICQTWRDASNNNITSAAEPGPPSSATAVVDNITLGSQGTRSGEMEEMGQEPRVGRGGQRTRGRNPKGKELNIETRSSRTHKWIIEARSEYVALLREGK